MRETVYINKFNAGACFLIRGDVNVIVDPGMAWCARRSIAEIEKIIGDAPVGAIFLTHSHYDHVGAVPYFRKRWPEAMVCASPYAGVVFTKPKALDMILRLSKEAARENGAVIEEEYDPSRIRADMLVLEGDEFILGDLRIKVIETPGHTRDSLSFVVDDEILMSSESMGFFNVDESYNPQYLVSYEGSAQSLEKSIAVQPRRVCIPHNGIYEEPGEDFWTFFREGIQDSKDFMIDVLTRYGEDQESALRAMEKRYWHPERFGGWPQEAYDVNALAMLKTIRREFLQTE